MAPFTKIKSQILPNLLELLCCAPTCYNDETDDLHKSNLTAYKSPLLLKICVNFIYVETFRPSIMHNIMKYHEYIILNPLYVQNLVYLMLLKYLKSCFNYEEPVRKHLAIMLDRIGCISETGNKYFNICIKYFHGNKMCII
jgi:hypothetical protein